QRAQTIDHLLIEQARARVVVAAERWRQLEGDEVVERDAGLRRLQILQTADEQPGAEEQQEAERDLSGDQALAENDRSRTARDRAEGVLERRPRIRAARAQRGHESEDDASRERQRQRERQD